MRLLLDTHALLWWLDGAPTLSARAIAAISADPTNVQVSAVTAWEITTKARIGKPPNVLDVAADVAGCAPREGFQPLSVTILHGQRAGGLPGPLRDPFDRMMIAQAMLDNLHLVSIEHTFDAYGVLRLWWRGPQECVLAARQHRRMHHRPTVAKEPTSRNTRRLHDIRLLHSVTRPTLSNHISQPHCYR